MVGAKSVGAVRSDNTPGAVRYGAPGHFGDLPVSEYLTRGGSGSISFLAHGSSSYKILLSYLLSQLSLFFG